MVHSLTQLAAEQQRRFDATTSPRERRERGHFGTAPAIAEFMAGMIPEIPQGRVRILDPGAGVGILSAALCQRVLRQHNQRHLVFELCENDPKLIPLLETTMTQCKKTLREAGHQMSFVIRVEDFILANRPDSLFDDREETSFDLAIINPPYFKLRKESEHAQVMAHVVHGQPNIYALFMAVAAQSLRDGGQMVAITPRSYFNGPYFKRFRKWFFDRMVARQIHVFDSRTEAFHEDAVLQENVILLAEKRGKPADVALTSCAGRDFRHVEQHSLAYLSVIENTSGDHLVRVPTSRVENEIVHALDRLTQRFRELPFKISTGPVVTFRATEFLRRERAKDTAPLLWMHNVRPFTMRFPPKNGKPTHIVVSDESRRLLLPAKRYVLLKRFTAKEEQRRLVAGVMEPSDSYSSFVGLENHLNYICRLDGELSESEALGLAAYFNSALVDRYFRAISGNTQVNAAEIRALPIPSLKTIHRIGDAIQRLTDRTPAMVERAVGEALGTSPQLIDELCEASR